MPGDAPITIELDAQKLIRELGIPGLDVEMIASAQRQNIDALSQANHLAAEGFHEVARRQAEILRQTFEAAMQSLSTAEQPAKRLEAQAALAQSALETALANMRHLAELVAKSNAMAFAVIDDRVAESLSELMRPKTRFLADAKEPQGLVDFLSSLPFGDLEIERSEKSDRDVDFD